MDIRLDNLNKTIVNCKKCPRLVKFINKVSTQKRKQNIDEVYWGKPVPGFGDLNSKLVKRRGRVYIINKKNPKFKARQK